MSHEAAPHTSTPDRSNSSTAVEVLDDTPEQAVARNILHENPELQKAIEDGVDLAISDISELKRATDKADKTFVIGVQLNAIGPSPVSLKIKRGRVHMEEKATKARQDAKKYGELEHDARLKVQANPNTHHRTSRKSRRLARKEIRENHNAEKYQGKIDYLTNAIAKEAMRKWEKESNPTRNTEGFRTLKVDLAKIEPELQRRQTLRAGIVELEKHIDAGTVTPGTPLHDQYLERKKQIESWGDETDEQAAERMKAEAVKKYRESLDEEKQPEKVKNYQTAEAKISQRLDAEDKINDPNTPADERKRLKEWSSQLAPLKEFGESLVRGDAKGFSDWIVKDANRELKEAIDQIDKDIKEEFKAELKELHELLEQYEKLVETNEWIDKQIANSSTDEEKARWTRVAAENDKEKAKLKQQLDDGYQKIEADRGFDEDRAREKIINKRMRIANIWPDSHENS